jgi:5'-3' exonuclease
MFTPGTTFMALLKDDLILYCAQRISSRYPEVKFYVSGADRSGEGEAKIFQHIMHRIPTTTPRQSCLIVGK